MIMYSIFAVDGKTQRENKECAHDNPEPGENV
jgi:hypothetical protein